VCLDGSFISVAHDRLIREALDPKWRAIHALPYSIPAEVLAHWESGGESGAEPERPRIFCDVFLGASLSRPANEGETERDVEREINAKIETIAEWLGLALLGLCTREASALVVFGKGSNGKSVLTSLVADLFGSDRTCHIPPQQMAERFSRAQLFGRAINVVSEMPEAELLASDTLKAIISGDSIEVERKHQDPFSFSPRAGHIFACNTLPSSRDRSWGLWRRLVPIEFHRVFGREDRDPRLLEKLRDEYDLLVPWALEHARLYLLRGGYAHIERINEYRHEWRSSTDSICAFVEAQTEPAELTDGAELKEIWKGFRDWAEDVGQSGSAKMSLNAFSRALCALPSIEKKRTGRDRKTKINRNLINERIKKWT
jgi:putative DNA primase/helicase